MEYTGGVKHITLCNNDIAAFIAVLKLTGIDYETYDAAGSKTNFWMNPTIVSKWFHMCHNDVIQFSIIFCS